jgi:hypothetical protein
MLYYIHNIVMRTQSKAQAYHIIKAPGPRRLSKGDRNYANFKVIISNGSKLAWSDDRKRSADKNGVDLGFEITKDFASKFEILQSYKYIKENLFSRVVDSRMASSGPSRVLLPGCNAVLNLFIKPKKYTRPGIYDLEILLKDARTGRILKGEPIIIRILLEIDINLDNRIEQMKDVGSVDYIYENKSFKQTKDIGKRQAVVMGVWKRIDLFDRTIKSLKGQSKDSVLYLWANHRDDDDRLLDLVDAADLPVRVYFSHSNIGGYGRFYAARLIADVHDSVVFIDDDQMPKKDFIKNLVSELARNKDSMIGAYAFVFHSKMDYWSDRHEPDVLASADYIGTCGMIIPTHVFIDDDLFRCPQKYWFIEDLWLTHFVVSRLKMQALRSSINFEDLQTLDDGRDQYNLLIDLKNEFLEYLVDNEAMQLVEATSQCSLEKPQNPNL